MRKYILVFITLVFTFPLWGSTIGSFSVSPTTKVTFAPGNLQYQASTNTWRFAEHQYDYVGDATQGNVYANGVKCDNAQISATYDGWIDLFGWGTSGYNDKYPYMTSPTATDYGDGEKDIAGTNYDWGVYNQIGDYPKGTWRTLTKDEWVYLYELRPHALELYGLATVNEVAGLIVLPDNWEIPSGLSFTAGIGSGFSTNTYTQEQWAQMETSGACFLPTAGFRFYTGTVQVLMEGGYYWASTYNESAYAHVHSFNAFNDSKFYSAACISLCVGTSVRLVHQLAEEGNTDIFLPYDATSLTPEQAAANPIHLAYPTAMQDKMPTIQCGEVKTEGVFSVSATEQIQFAPGNLQYQASTNTWRFAEHQYDYVGDATQGNVYVNGVKCDNTQISATYDGWIDLFGWGTSGFNNKYPYMTSTNYSDYGDGEKDIAGTNYDWGVNNKIGEDPKGTWRTLTKDEWGYLYCTRKNAADLWGHGTVNGVAGTILLPDDWVLPSGLSFVAGTKGMPYDGYYYGDKEDNHFKDNIYTTAQWKKMEAAGACFLPAVGWRDETSMSYVQTHGYYWSSTLYHSYYAHFLGFEPSRLYPQGVTTLDYGKSVRLVRTL